MHPPPEAYDDVSNARGTTEVVSTNDTVGHINGVGSEGQCAAIGSVKSRVSLRIVPVRVSGVSFGREVETYAFLGDGSDTTLCLTSLTEELGLFGTPTDFALTTVNAEDEVRSSREVQLTVKALKSDESVRLDRVWTFTLMIVSSLSQQLRKLQVWQDS